MYGPTCPLEVGDAQPVDEDVVVAAEARDRPAHREVGRVVDVEPVDVGDRRGAHADRDGPPADDRGESLPLGRADSVFESRTPGIRWQLGGMITAAATTAPQVGATPTSSTPATRVAPSRHSGRSQRRVGTITAIAAIVPRRGVVAGWPPALRRGTGGSQRSGGSGRPGRRLARGRSGLRAARGTP